jgi:hypothetical protein
MENVADDGEDWTELGIAAAAEPYDFAAANTILLIGEGEGSKCGGP